MRIILDREWMGNPKGKHLNIVMSQALRLLERGTAHIDPKEGRIPDELKKGGIKIILDKEWMGNPAGKELCIVERHARRMIDRGTAHEVVEKKEVKKQTKEKKAVKKKQTKKTPASSIKRRGQSKPQKDKMVGTAKNK